MQLNIKIVYMKNERYLELRWSKYWKVCQVSINPGIEILLIFINADLKASVEEIENLKIAQLLEIDF